MVERRELGRGGSAVRLRFLDEFDGGFGWIPEGDKLRRTSHALVADRAVWLVDAVDGDGLDERVRAAGEPAGVIQLLDRHNRDCAAVAARLGVPHHAVPFAGVRDSPFRLLRVVSWPKWREVALWWPERRVLVCADALGTIGYFRTKGEAIGVHPFLRVLKPPRGLLEVEPERVLVGHGPGVHEDGAAQVREAVRTARRRLPSALRNTFNAGGL